MTLTGNELWHWVLMGISNFIFAIWRASQLLILGATLPSAGKLKHGIRKAGCSPVFSCSLINLANVISLVYAMDKTTRRFFLWDTDVALGEIFQWDYYWSACICSKVSVRYSAEAPLKKKRRDERCGGNSSRVMARGEQKVLSDGMSKHRGSTSQTAPLGSSARNCEVPHNKSWRDPINLIRQADQMLLSFHRWRHFLWISQFLAQLW